MAECKGMIFDLDGVVTGTARVHSLAWKAMFDNYLKLRADREGEPFAEFTDADYLTYVDGKPRMKGVQSFLESRGIRLPFGDHDDSPEMETVCGLGNTKNADFQRILKEEGPEIYATTVAFIQELKARGVRVGVASSSRNCRLILELAGLTELFETRVDGDVSLELGLSGKPDPDIFTTAAANLGLLPGECGVVEDAISGVQAGRAGNFGLTLGVARETPGEVLLANGADLVVADLGEIDADGVARWFAEGIGRDGWRFGYTGFDPANEKLRETLTSVGNGYLAVRGAFETERAGETSYPGTYMAGVFNKVPTPMHGRDIYNNDLVNCPNWLLVELRIGKGAFVSPLSMRILSYRHELNMADGTMGRELVVMDQLGRVTRIESRRLASMHDPHLLALSFTVEPVNHEEDITFRPCIDGAIINDGVARYRALNQQHLEFVDSGKAGRKAEEGVYLHVRTTASGYDIAMAQRCEVFAGGRRLEGKDMARSRVDEGALVGEEITVPGRRGVAVTLEKVVRVQTSLDGKDPVAAAKKGLAKAGSFKQLFKPHAKAWARLWARADILVEGDRLVQRTARLHAYHLMVTASPHNAELDAGMPARGLTGEAYRGHIFWDEVYIHPFYDLRFPEVSRALLTYRHNRLEGARAYAAEHGYRGAMFPWQTADGGEEETQEVHYNPKNDSWGPDLSRRQRHVSIAVFYNAWRYARTAQDKDFLDKYGAELMLSIATFWGSIAQKDEADGKYHIDGVMGPDEFHEKLHGTDTDGVRDNAYTNILVSWLLERARELAAALPPARRAALLARAGADEAALDRWADVARNLAVHVQDGIIEQFHGYFGLEELDWDGYRAKYGDIHRLDRILKAEGDSPDKYKLAKQADTLMTFYLLTPGQVAEILGVLGIPVEDAAAFLKANYDYYEGRTSHGSTLSKVVHAVISAHFGDDETAWKWFMEALVSDIEDTQGGTTPEGIHTGVMAGTLDLLTKYFAGVDSSGDLLAVNPHLPAHFTRLAMPLVFRGVRYHLELTPGKVRLEAETGKDAVHALVRGTSVELKPGKPRTVTLNT
jgi:beta-phosphoglucomutase family hydrolase